ncbi:MAG: 30S ribosome-binding factor RbfA [Erysipelothrix sp.]|nr:30S ribosome-binding factor RbfA [Erysipelothrix sp.]
MSVKKDRIESVIKREIAMAITTQLNDPALKFASVTDVEVSDDLSFATVFVSFIREEDKEKGIEVLVKSKGFLRTIISKSIKTRRVPVILIKLDESSEKGSKIDDILNKIKED